MCLGECSYKHSLSIWTRRFHICWLQSSLELYGIVHGSPLDPVESHGMLHLSPRNASCFISYGTLLDFFNSMQLGDIWFGDCRVPRNSMEYSMEVRGNSFYILSVHYYNFFCFTCKRGLFIGRGPWTGFLVDMYLNIAISMPRVQVSAKTAFPYY